MKRELTGRLPHYVVAGLAAVIGVTGSFAGDNRLVDPRNLETRSVTVSYPDLDLSKEAGIATLYQRLGTAARSVCGGKDLRRLEDVREWKRCNRAALKDAVDQVNDLRLTMLHEERGNFRKRPLVPIAGLP